MSASCADASTMSGHLVGFLCKKPTCQPQTEHLGPINRRENLKLNKINMTRCTRGGSRDPSGLVDNALAFETMGTGFEPRWEHHHSLRNDSVYRHLTNYAVNKHHAEYNRSADEMSGSKRSFTFFNNYIRDVKQCNPLDIWQKIRDLIVKTIAIALPHLLHSYRMCRYKSNHFSNTKLPKDYLNKQTGINNVNEKCSMSNELNNELKSNLSNVKQQQHHHQQQRINNKDSSQHLGANVKQSTKASKRYRDSNEYLSTSFIRSNLFEILGFDILLDKNLNPWLIEVNRSPSFNSDQELDKRVKHGLLTDTFRLLNIR
ncbi:unnamed protein product [Trichobilharzia regenti]|nr:unnamed protein product [Trichobilharzia regenti]